MFNNFKKRKINTNIYFSENIGNRIKNNNSNLLIKIILISLLIIFFLWIFIKNSYNNFKTNPLIKDELIIEIKKWYSINDLANELKINNRFLKLYIKKNIPNFKLIAWTFKITKEATINEILDDLKKPLTPNQINITLLEWWNIYDIDSYLSEKKLIKKDEYINYVTNTNKINQLSKFFPFIKWLNTLEWYLYPDTYSIISNNFKINVLVIKQLENFENKVYNKILSNLNNKEIRKIINLASIVEKEEKNISEKSTVAWILKKRLENWWMIWADITVCYPHKLTSNECKMVITKYINEKSEYNTRTMTWLPKTPIWNPSFETINATLNYKNTSHWFYLHDTKTWKIYYADSNQWHTINKNRYLR